MINEINQSWAEGRKENVKGSREVWNLNFYEKSKRASITTSPLYLLTH